MIRTVANEKVRRLITGVRGYHTVRQPAEELLARRCLMEMASEPLLREIKDRHNPYLLVE
jgi:hypothetical protein